MSAEIVGVGLATAQGGSRDLAEPGPETAPQPIPWPLRSGTHQLCRPARGIDASSVGTVRWNALARAALRDAFGDPLSVMPLVVASSNGGTADLEEQAWAAAFDTSDLLADTPWHDRAVPVVSGSCASGAHGLLVAQRMLDAGHHEVAVLVVDILSAASVDNFSALRVLSPTLEIPWQGDNSGFLPGEAAVVLRLRKPTGNGLRLGAVRATTDRGQGLTEVLADLERSERAIMQGTGPTSADAAELSALRNTLSDDCTITTAGYHFGHTIGPASILGLALDAVGCQHHLGRGATSDGRRFSNERRGSTVLACRALTSATTAIATFDSPPLMPRWSEPLPRPALSIPTLRAIDSAARQHRPDAAPSAVFVHFEAPLLPPPRTRSARGILPSTVLELSPGFAASVIARAWGYRGPSVAVVGGNKGSNYPKMKDFAAIFDSAPVLYVRGDGHDRTLSWGP